MALRITIGATTYSAVTASGLTFLADSKDGPTADPAGVRFTFNTETAEFPFYIHCAGADEAATKTLVDGVVDTINNPDMFDDVTVDNGSSGDVIATFVTSDGTYRSRAGEATVEWWSETEAFVRCRLVFSNVQDFARGGGGGGVQQLVDGAIEAQCERNTGGYLQVVLSATFRPIEANPAMDAAQDWVESIIDRSSAPSQIPWLPGKDVLRVIDNFFQVVNHDSTNTSQDRVQATIVLREIDPQLTTAIAQIKAIDFDVSQKAQNLPSRFNPGWEATISGQIEYKRAGLTAFDPNDSPDGYLTQAAAVVALNLIIAAATTRQGWGSFAAVSLDLAHGGSQGVYRFQITGIADAGTSPYITVTEHIVSRDSDLTFTDADTGNHKWNYGVGDSLKTYVHRLEVTRIGSQDTYLRPAEIPGRYSIRDTTEDKLTPVSIKDIGVTAGGGIKYATVWEVVYEDFTGDGTGTQAQGTVVNVPLEGQ